MELKIVELQSKGIFNNLLQSLRRMPKQIDLVLNIRFGEHEQKLDDGIITFGLKRGKLKINLINGEVPLENIKLKDTFSINFEKEIQVEEEAEDQSGLKITGGIELSSGAKHRGKSAEKIKYSEYQVRTEGELKEPVWVFEARCDEKLRGVLQNAELVSVNITAIPCFLIATLIADQEDICIIDTHLYLKKRSLFEFPRLHKKVIEQGMISKFQEEILKNQKKPYLSRAELSHE